MKLDLISDRALRRPDPVEAREGVFAELTKDEMSPAEIARAGKHKQGAEISTTPPPKEPPKRWSPEQILQRLTKMYKNFTKPSPSTKGNDK